MSAPDELLTHAEVAQMFRVTAKTVGRWANSGRLPAIWTPGGHARFRRSTVMRLLEASR